MYMAEILRDYNIYISTALLFFGVFIIAYLLAKIYRNPKEIKISDLFLIILSTSLISGGLLLHLIYWNII